MNTFIRRAVVAVAAVCLVGTPVAAVGAVTPSAGTLTSEVPVKGTPHVLDGQVYAVVKVGDTVVLGGTFTKAQEDGGTVQYNRSGLLAFSASTGKISQTFVPQPDGQVKAIVPAADGKSVFIGGGFNNVAGQAASRVARLNLSDGKPVAGFNVGSVTGIVNDLRLVGSRLWLGGGFTHVGGTNQPALATVNADTGKFDPYMRRLVAGTHNAGTTTVVKMDVTPDASTLVAVGNFDTLDGVKRHQIFELDLTGPAALPRDWQTAFFQDPCSSSFNTYMRDVDISPDGKFFVVSTTGAWGGSTQVACDSQSRWDLSVSGSGAKPSWVTHTGGDTTYGVEITDSAVYVGGHMRWENNPFAGDQAGAGAIAREGIAALDPVNGMPFTWNPGRTRGVGVFDFLNTPAGLWVASDTDRIGANYYRGRIALLPYPGIDVPRVRTPGLPNDLYQVTSSTLYKRSASTTAFGAADPQNVSGLSWSGVKGAFMVNGQLYTMTSDGLMTRRSFDGSTLGSPVAVNTSDLIVPLTSWQSDIKAMTGSFYDNGRIYFTKSGSNALYYRYFTPQSGAVGAKLNTATTGLATLDFSKVRGMFVAGDKLYYTLGDGNLRSIAWDRQPSAGVPSGASTLVSGPAVDGRSWASSTAMWLFQDEAGDNVASAPTASYTSSCTSLTCTLDAGSSSANSGSISSYSWDFGDGTTGSGVSPTHTFPSSGTYPVSLTVTNSKGLSSTTQQQVQVTKVNRDPVASFTSGCGSLSCSFDASGSSDPDGDALTYAWDFGDGSTGSGKTPSHDYTGNGSYTVTLTVSDGQGGVAQAQQVVQVTEAAARFVAANTTNGNRTSHTTNVPGAAQAGDQLLAFLTLNSTDVTAGFPAGWTVVSDVNVAGSGLRTVVLGRTAQAGDAGSAVTVSTSAFAKSDLAVAAYRGTPGTTLTVGNAAAALRTVNGTSFTTPTVSVPAGGGSLLVSYWASKLGTAPTWTAPSGQLVRSSTAGTGGGAISGLLTDDDQTLRTSDAGGLTAVLSGATNRVGVASVVLRAAAG